MSYLGATLARCCRQLTARASQPVAISKIQASPLTTGIKTIQLQFGFLSVRNFASKEKMGLPRVFFDMTADGQPLGRIVMEVRGNQLFLLVVKKKLLELFSIISASNSLDFQSVTAICKSFMCVFVKAEESVKNVFVRACVLNVAKEFKQF